MVKKISELLILFSGTPTFHEKFWNAFVNVVTRLQILCESRVFYVPNGLCACSAAVGLGYTVRACSEAGLVQGLMAVPTLMAAVAAATSRGEPWLWNDN